MPPKKKIDVSDDDEKVESPLPEPASGFFSVRENPSPSILLYGMTPRKFWELTPAQREAVKLHHKPAARRIKPIAEAEIVAAAATLPPGIVSAAAAGPTAVSPSS
eukprot:TRINITY_DN13052_c0_g1_i1.p1 TRINITY_DN13052_c0_g1~~TRINITY_DN13052_c0_g1_i1.p1  ORF type:complete len:122 (+),score=27.38 TRINITY_DN13052_c0_g1_i1:53-367(+)